MTKLVPIVALLCLHPDAGAPARPPLDPANAGRELRKLMLSSSPADFSLKPSKEFPLVYGVVMDWPLNDYVVTVTSFSSGDASLYTTTKFGILGGVGHERVRAAAIRLVREAAPLAAQAKPATDQSYPPSNKIRFHLLTFRGVKTIEDEHSAVENGKSKLSAIFVRAQDVLTELRRVTETPKK
jgi:hypothetical protein